MHVSYQKNRWNYQATKFRLLPQFDWNSFVGSYGGAVVSLGWKDPDKGDKTPILYLQGQPFSKVR